MNHSAISNILKAIETNAKENNAIREQFLNNAISWTAFNKESTKLLEAWGELGQALSNASGMRYSGHWPTGLSYEQALELPEFYASKYQA
jgi:hypothetical protein